MITPRELDELVILYPIRLVNQAIVGIKALHGKALLRLVEEVVYLLADALGGHVVFVVLMRGEARPVALGAVCFANGENLGVCGAVDNKAGFSLEGLRLCEHSLKIAQM